MRAVVAGAGRIGTFHARTLAGLAAVEQVAIIDSSMSAASMLAEALHATGGAAAVVMPTVDAALELGVDLLVVAAPTALHAPLTLQAVDAGVAVFCEKPIARTLEEALDVVERVERSGTLVQIGFQRRFDPAIRAMAEARMRGELGHLYLVRSSTHDADPPAITYAEDEDGLFTETLIHDFDAVRFLTGQEVVRVSALSAQAAPDATGIDVPVDHAAVLLELSDGAQAVVTGCRHDPRGYDVRAELLGSLDSLAVGYGDAAQMRRLDVSGAGETDALRARRYDDFLDRFAEAYRDELRAFVDCVQEGAPSLCSVRDGYAALAVAAAAWRARSSGTSVDVSELPVPS